MRAITEYLVDAPSFSLPISFWLLQRQYFPWLSAVGHRSRQQKNFLRAVFQGKGIGVRLSKTQNMVLTVNQSKPSIEPWVFRAWGLS